MSWGYKIALVYLGFVALIFSLIFRTCSENTDLEYTDYYQREVNYQEQINSSQALINSGLKPEVIVNAKQVQILIPDSLRSLPFSGQVEFHRSNNAALDVVTDLNSSQTGTVIPGERLVTGLYNVRINWNSTGTNYSYETTVTIP